VKPIVVLLALLTTSACAEPLVLPSPSAQAKCPASTTRDGSGVITAAGDIGLLEIRPGRFADEKIIVLVRRGAILGDRLYIRATPAPGNAPGEVDWSTPATAHANAWGDVVFEANTKPIGNTGCWRIERGDGPRDGIIVDLGR